MLAEPVDGAGASAASESSDPRRLIATRLRHGAAAAGESPLVPLQPFNLGYWFDGDAGHLQRAGDLTSLPVSSHRRLGGPIIVAAKRTLRRLLFPVLDVQASVNAANARVVAFMLGQLAAQARHVEELERQLAELRAERER